MPKPIFIMNVPSYFTTEHVSKITHKLSDQLKDYHVLVVLNNLENIRFECFYEKDLTHIKFEELKDILNNKN